MMPPAIFSTTQSRWTLQALLVILSAVAIASSAPPSVGGTGMYSGGQGDIRGLIVLVASIGLVGIFVLRIAALFLPRPWRVYVDRLEFTFVSMLWIIWTSATMAFSAFTLEKGVCNRDVSDIYLPACPLLTFDLSLLHLLSTATLALMLVIVSTTLVPGYYESFSTLSSLDTEGGLNAEGEGVSLLSRAKSKFLPSSNWKSKSSSTSIGGHRDVFVMWDLALASPPTSPLLTPTRLEQASTYGSVAVPQTTTITNDLIDNPYVSHLTNAVEQRVQKKRDKFAEGRVPIYVALLLCSLVAVGCASAVIGNGSQIGSSVYLILVGSLSITFSVCFLGWHFLQRLEKITDVEKTSFRALEVGMAASLFLLWPLAAVIYTLLPSTPNRPCSNPSASSAPFTPDPFPGDGPGLTCVLSCAAVTASWLASWIVLARVMGLVFPMPNVPLKSISSTFPTHTALLSDRYSASQARALGGAEGEVEERRSFFPTSPKSSSKFGKVAEVEATLSQVKYGRLVAGEAFELGDADDDYDDT